MISPTPFKLANVFLSVIAVLIIFPAITPVLFSCNFKALLILIGIALPDASIVGLWVLSNADCGENTDMSPRTPFNEEDCFSFAVKLTVFIISSKSVIPSISAFSANIGNSSYKFFIISLVILAVNFSNLTPGFLYKSKSFSNSSNILESKNFWFFTRWFRLPPLPNSSGNILDMLEKSTMLLEYKSFPLKLLIVGNSLIFLLFILIEDKILSTASFSALPGNAFS